MKKNLIITIDGPAGTGKTTIAKLVAEKLGFLFFDTGAIYRALTYQILKEAISLEDKTKINDLISRFNFDIQKIKGERHYFIGQEDVTQKIRDPNVTRHVSRVSAIKEVRSALLVLQRRFGMEGSAVFEGRDMGSVVFPQADLKVFLTARPAVRAERRYLEIKTSRDTTQEEIFQEILTRDASDSSREIAPLKQPADAHLIDTSDLTIPQVVDMIVSLVDLRK